MQASIYSHQQLIGYAALRVGDKSMGGIYGEFIPTAAYYGQVQKTIWEFNTANSSSHSKWHTLALNAQLENGYFLFPLGGCEITDSPNFPDEPKRIYLIGISAEIIEDFVEADPPRTFVEEPWEPLTIQQKLKLEAELQREIGSDSIELLLLVRQGIASS